LTRWTETRDDRAARIERRKYHHRMLIMSCRSSTDQLSAVAHMADEYDQSRTRHAMIFRLVMTVALVSSTSAFAVGITAKQVTEILFAADAARPADFSGKDLSALDLAGLNFKQARLQGANLYAADLSRADLAKTDLSGARLDAASVTRTNFSGANLSGATLLTITAYASIEPDPADAPNFANANLSRADIAARLDGADFSGADLSGARLGRLVATWGSFRPRAVLNGAKFTSARMRRTDLGEAMLRFADFRGADLTEANLKGCDLSSADFTGADFTGADVTNADFDGAILKNVKGLAAATGLPQARNLAKARR
jgi:uncharacterized protein YjbI with pentapeptide repeats